MLFERKNRETSTPGGDEWVTEIAKEKVGAAHLNGIPWHQAQIPSRLHRCTPQTKGWVNYFTPVERCACGAIRYGEGHRWFNKNSSRRSTNN